MTNWEIPQADVLSAVSVTSTPTETATIDHQRVVDTHALQVALSGFSGTGAVFVIVQGSLDGTNWYNLISFQYESGWSAFGLFTETGPARYTRVYAFATTDTSATVTASVVSGLA